MTQEEWYMPGDDDPYCTIWFYLVWCAEKLEILVEFPAMGHAVRKNGNQPVPKHDGHISLA